MTYQHIQQSGQVDALAYAAQLVQNVSLAAQSAKDVNALSAADVQTELAAWSQCYQEIQGCGMAFQQEQQVLRATMQQFQQIDDRHTADPEGTEEEWLIAERQAAAAVQRWNAIAQSIAYLNQAFSFTMQRIGQLQQRLALASNANAQIDAQRAETQRQLLSNMRQGQM